MIGTRFNIIDLSEIPQSESVVTPANAPLILSCGPTAKGTEKMIEISGEDYKKMYGGPDFKKFGQVSVQNQRMIDAGAKLLFKRVAASDATLANITTCADIKVVPNLKNQYDENQTNIRAGCRIGNQRTDTVHQLQNQHDANRTYTCQNLIFCQ